MPIWSVFGLNLGAAVLLMAAGWGISLLRKNVTIADSLWGIGIVLIAWLTFINGDGFLFRKLLLCGLVTAWGVRLFLYMFQRSRNKAEDARYAAWRKRHGQSFWWVSLFKVFLLQAVFQWLIALGVQYGQLRPQPAHLTWLDVAGALVWAAGFAIETAADRQLSEFLSIPENRGKIMNRKLWRYSRHPNYFGESLMWWGLFGIVLSVPWGVWTIVSPVLITYTLLRLSGVRLMETVEFGESPEYQAYARRTNAFIPWFPKP
jgi:steroid 5-alpha reductase family enzyme